MKSVVLLGVLLVASGAWAEEWGFAYSGKLMEDLVESAETVEVLFTGRTNLYVRLYDESEGAAAGKASALWGRLVQADLKDGSFFIEVKDSCGIPLAGMPCGQLADVFARLAGSRMKIGVTPFTDDNAEISPRQSLVSVPFAVNAFDTLGLMGDLNAGGLFTAGGMCVGEVTFGGPTDHKGATGFAKDPGLGDVQLGSAPAFSAARLETLSPVGLATVSAGTLAVSNLNAQVASLGGLVATSLNVSDGNGAQFQTLTAERDGDVQLTGDVQTDRLEASNFVMDGTVQFFQGEPNVIVLSKNASGGEAYEYSGTSWTAPASTSYNHFLSMTFKLAEGNGMATVSVGGVQVAKLSATALKGDVYLPFQTFLRPGEKISWSGEVVDGSIVVRVVKW